MTTFMPAPPASTFLAFHPQDNNIIAIGMEDSTIHIYNVRVDEVITYYHWLVVTPPSPPKKKDYKLIMIYVLF